MVLPRDLGERPALVQAVHRGGQLALVAAELRRLAEARVEPAGQVGGPARRVHRALVELGAVGRVGEPVAAVRVRHHVVGRVEPLAVEHGREDGRRPVELVAHHAPGDVLAGELAALEVERVAVAVVRRRAEHADVPVVLDPAHLAVVRDVAPHQVAALGAPRRPFRPERAGPQPLDRRVRLPETVEHGLDREHVRVGEVGGGRAARAEVPRRRGDRAGRGHRPARRRLRANQMRREHRGAHRRAHAAEHHPPRHRG